MRIITQKGNKFYINGVEIPTVDGLTIRLKWVCPHCQKANEDVAFGILDCKHCGETTDVVNPMEDF